MKIEIDLEKEFPGEWREVKTREEYDDLTYSPAGMLREQQGVCKNGVRRSHGPIYAYAHDPLHFPCLLMEGVIRPNSKGADLIETFYLYHYKKLEHQNEDETEPSTN